MIASFTASAQVTTMGGKKTTIENLGGFKSDSTLAVPRVYATANYLNADSIARLWLQPAPLALYYHDGVGRRRIADSIYVSSAISAITPSQHTYIFKALSVDMSVLGNTIIGTTDVPYLRFVATSFTYVVKATSGTVVVAPNISIGFTPSSYTDIVSSVTLTSSPTVNRSTYATAGSSTTTPSSTAIIVKVNTAATFSTTGTYFVDIYVQGYYEIL